MRITSMKGFPMYISVREYAGMYNVTLDRTISLSGCTGFRVQTA